MVVFAVEFTSLGLVRFVYPVSIKFDALADTGAVLF
jgi:hypothetical protein